MVLHSSIFLQFEDSFLEIYKVSSSTLLFPKLLSSLPTSVENPWHLECWIIDPFPTWPPHRTLLCLQNAERGCASRYPRYFTLDGPGIVFSSTTYKRLHTKNPQSCNKMHEGGRSSQPARTFFLVLIYKCHGWTWGENKVYSSCCPSWNLLSNYIQHLLLSRPRPYLSN